MQIVAFVSGKGGVGKTTLCANVAIALSQLGKRVLVIDLDPQNALGLHLGLAPGDPSGHSRDGIEVGSIYQSPFGISFIPFGVLQDAELDEFEDDLKAHPGWLRHGIQQLGEQKFDFILLDTPPGPTVFLRQALHTAHRALAVVLADAASFATVPSILSLCSQYTQDRQHFAGVNLLINQFSHRGQLAHQVRTALLATYGAIVLPAVVHRNQLVAEALAYERPVLQYDPGCEASIEIHNIADWLLCHIES